MYFFVLPIRFWANMRTGFWLHSNWTSINAEGKMEHISFVDWKYCVVVTIDFQVFGNFLELSFSARTSFSFFFFFRWPWPLSHTKSAICRMAQGDAESQEMYNGLKSTKQKTFPLEMRGKKNMLIHNENTTNNHRVPLVHSSKSGQEQTFSSKFYACFWCVCLCVFFSLARLSVYFVCEFLKKSFVFFFFLGVRCNYFYVRGISDVYLYTSFVCILFLVLAFISAGTLVIFIRNT